MKKLILGLAAIGLIVASCEKDEDNSIILEENVETTQENAIVLDEERPNDVEQNRASTRWFVEPEEGDVFCETHSPTNCGNTVEVTPTANQVAIDDVFTAVESGVRADIIEEFETHITLLKASIPASYVDGVIDETYTVTSRGEFSSGKIGYLKFSNTGLLYVHPYTM